MNNRTIIKYFTFSAVSVAVICFVIFLSKNSVYRGETKVLLISKNSIIDERMDVLAENAKNIPLTLSFYDRLVKSGEIEDPKDGFSSKERKGYWIGQIKTERVAGSHIIKVIAYDQNEGQAMMLTDVYAHELSNTLAGYYDIRYQLETRLIEEPISSFDFGKSIWPQAAKSIFWGIVAGFLDILLISVIPKKRSTKNNTNFKKNIFSYASSNTEKITEPDYFPPFFTKKNEVGREERIVTPGRKSSAPENLPFADEETMKIFEQKLYANGNGKKEEKKETPAKQEPEKLKEDIFREATPEEVKERLNKLLSGKM